MVKGLTLGKSGYHDGDECRNQEDAYGAEDYLVAPSPDGTCDALQELGDCEFADPDEQSIVDARCQDQFRADLPEMDFVVGQVFRLHIVGAVHQDDVHQAHARKQRYQAQRHDAVLLEQSSSADLPPSQAHEDDGDCKASTPPAEEERRPVSTPGARLRRGIVPYAHVV